MDGYDQDFGGWRAWRERPARLPRAGWRGDARHFGGGAYDVGFGYDAGLRMPDAWAPAFGYGGFAPIGRGVYGEAYPGPAEDLRGVPYGADEGLGPQPASGEPIRPRRRGYDDSFGGSLPLSRSTRGYDRGFDRAREPFLPDRFYAAHPEYRNAPHRPAERWQVRHEGAPLDDREVRARVRDTLARDAWVDESRVRVDVRDGVVTLAGEVGDFMEARYAWDDAWETDGVRGVVTRLTVRTDVPDPHPHGDILPQG